MITDDPRLTAVGLLAETFAGLHAKLAPAFAAHGIAPLEFEVLLRLARSPAQRLRMTDLAAQAGMSTSGVTRIVDRLARSGTVERQTCPSDRRGSFAVLTEEGARRLAAVLPDHLADIDRWFTGVLSPGQLAGLLDALRTIRSAVRPGATAGTAGTSGPACATSDVSDSADSGDHSPGEVISSG